MRGLFINTAKALCSIHESGFAVYKTLSKSKEFTLEYCEVSLKENKIKSDFDFYIFNYHWVQMKWLDTEVLKRKLNRVYTIVLEVEPRNPFFRLSPVDFDGYLVLDPTCESVQNNVITLPRPLIDLKSIKNTSVNINNPTIGSFGLGYIDKGFDELILAVEKEFNNARIKINLPTLELMSENEKNSIIDIITSYSTKPNIQIEITSINMDRAELVEWCSKNDLNAFFYNHNRRIGNGLSATTDQAISSGVPIAISTNPTFRHIMEYVKPYPFMNLREAILTGSTTLSKIRNNWESDIFVSKFEGLLKETYLERNLDMRNELNLPIKKPTNTWRTIIKNISFLDFIPPVVLKFFRFTHQIIERKKILGKNQGKPSDVNAFFFRDSVGNYSHTLLKSFSWAFEDLLIDFLTGGKTIGTYVDIGANNPKLGSNTHRFYLKGWRGINIEPNETAFKLLQTERPSDINLNFGISDNEGTSILKLIGKDASISEINDKNDVAEEISHQAEITKKIIKVTTLKVILDQYLEQRKIDFLTVDTEGHDLKVLKGNDWLKFRPTLVIVEASRNASAIVKFMESQNYLFILSNSVNAFFADKNTDSAPLLELLQATKSTILQH